MRYRLAVIILSIFLPLIPSALAQDLPLPDPEVVHPNLRLTIGKMPLVKAPDENRVSIVKAAVATVLGAADVQCDPGSQLYAVLEANAASPLRTLSAKIAGTFCAINGHANPLKVTFTPNIEIRADDVVAAMMRQQPLLMEWNSVLYVVHGVIYDEHLHNSGKRENVIRELLLLDPRYSDDRRFVFFDRQRDEFSQVAGVAEISCP